MSKLAADLGAINLSQGYPDFDCDPALVDAVARHMRDGRNQYAPMQGVPALRQAIAGKFEDLYSSRYDPDTEVTVTSGGTEAIFDAVAAVVHPGDEVIVFEPVYDSYVPAIEVSGGKAIVVSLRYPDYRIPWDEVRAAVTPRTRTIMVNSPNNPTATILGADDMAALSQIVDGTAITIVSDEVYEHIVFDGARHESMARYDALRSRTHHGATTFFVSIRGTMLFHHSVLNAFREACALAGIPGRARIHDLRHSLAVNTLLDWYRSGEDIDAEMPALSGYLGHVRPEGTYWYISSTPELMQLAAARAAGKEGRDE